MLRILVIFINLLIFIGCVDFKAKKEFDEGRKYQEQYKYQDAISKYKEVVRKYPKTQWADSAQKNISTCETLLSLLDEISKVDSLLEKGEYELAEKKLNHIMASIVMDINISKKVQQRINKIDEIKKTRFEYIWKIVKKRLDEGASAQTALGEFYGTEIKWKARPGDICFGLSSLNPPVVFKIGKDGEFYGVPSYGVDRLKFLLFCESNKGKLVTVEGRLIGVYPFPFEGLIVEVSSLSKE